MGIPCLLVFGPWAFGSTQLWSIWVLNVGSYCLGVLLAVKLLIRAANIRSQSPFFRRESGESGVGEDSSTPDFRTSPSYLPS